MCLYYYVCVYAFLGVLEKKSVCLSIMFFYGSL